MSTVRHVSRRPVDAYRDNCWPTSDAYAANRETRSQPGLKQPIQLPYHDRRTILKNGDRIAMHSVAIGVRLNWRQNRLALTGAHVRGNGDTADEWEMAIIHGSKTTNLRDEGSDR
jgi:hypothetical protein